MGREKGQGRQTWFYLHVTLLKKTTSNFCPFHLLHQARPPFYAFHKKFSIMKP